MVKKIKISCPFIIVGFYCTESNVNKIDNRIRVSPSRESLHVKPEFEWCSIFTSVVHVTPSYCLTKFTLRCVRSIFHPLAFSRRFLLFSILWRFFVSVSRFFVSRFRSLIGFPLQALSVIVSNTEFYSLKLHCKCKFSFFLDLSMHLNKRSCPSVCRFFRPSVDPSVRLSIFPSVP